MIEAKPLLAIAALRASVESALDAGVFYETDFKAACRPAWDAAIPVVENRLPDVMRDDDAAWETRKAQYQEASARVKAGPRGTWLVIVNVSASGARRFESVMADGMGEVQTRSDGWAAMPTFDAVVTRLVGYEVYTARKAVEEERRRAAAIKRLHELGLRVGVTLRNVEVSRHPFSTVVVEAADPLTGSVTFFATKRGSKKRFRLQTNALAVELKEPVLATAPPRATPDHSHVLFSV